MPLDTAEKNKKKKSAVSAALLFTGNIIFFLTLWLLQKYDRIYVDQFLFQMKTTSVGIHNALAGSAVLRVGVFGIVLTAIEALMYLLLSGQLKEKMKKSSKYIAYCATKVCSFFSKRTLTLSATALILAILIFASQLNVFAYIETSHTESNFIEKHYISPYEAQITFPKEKRNLIYIFLESMENTYADISAGGSISTDYIPELTSLAKDNISFSNTSGIGGALPFAGTTWTAAAMVAQTAGIPVKVSLTSNAYGDENIFMPGAVSIGEILEKQGYNQVLLLGSNAEFHGREPYFVQHGNYEITDTESLKEAGRLAEDYKEWWGFEDEKLFEYAKEELTRLACENEPFNLTLLTADTHFPNGYECRLCEDKYSSQYANVLSCSSKQVYQFVSWIKEQPFYENTTIIISGDHLTMDSEFMEDIDEEYVRTTYNCIINSPIEPVREKNRQFATFDMFPTTLAAIGADIEGDRLGLGTNLFSDMPTLTEEYGAEALDKELQKKSVFYNTKFLEES